MRNTLSSILLSITIVTGFGMGVANAGNWCDAAIEEAAKPPSANPGAGNPFQNGNAGATLGNALGQLLFCFLDW
ncbi:hypothetical protein ACI0FM_09220 [Paenochrobactrum sp. BZR 588]|uniref:hypothetical protein n=1 Tax=unclassified Paenochrobactrum TaxID=2639760 RepID=UPI003853A44A